MAGSIDRQGSAATKFELRRPRPVKLGWWKDDSSKAERKTRVRTIKFNLDQETEVTGGTKRNQHKSDTELMGALKNPTTTSAGGQGKKPRKKGILRKTGVSQSLARMVDAVKDKRKTQAKRNSAPAACITNLTDHMEKLKEKQSQEGLQSLALFHESDPSLAPLPLDEFDKGGPRSRRRRSSRGKSVPLKRRSFPSTRFCEADIPPLIPYPSKPTLGRLSPVYFDCGTGKSKLLGSNVLDMESERFMLPALVPEKNDSAAMSA